MDEQTEKLMKALQNRFPNADIQMLAEDEESYVYDIVLGRKSTTTTLRLDHIHQCMTEEEGMQLIKPYCNSGWEVVGYEEVVGKVDVRPIYDEVKS